MRAKCYFAIGDFQGEYFSVNMWKVSILFGFMALLLTQAFGQNRAEADTLSVRVGPLTPEKNARYHVTVYTDDQPRFTKWLAVQALRYKKVTDHYFLVSDLDDRQLSLLRKVRGVKFIDRGIRKAREEVVLGDFDLSVNAVTATHAQFPGTAGNGLLVSVKEKPFDQQDLDLKGRIVLNDQFDEAATFHATFMATIAVGAGNTSPFAKGVAWQASVTTSDFDQLLPDDGDALRQAGVSVQNHSYGVGLENYYGIESRAYDQAGITHPEILHVFSSGNRGGDTPVEGAYNGVSGFANLTGQFKVAKNVLTVGSADRFGNYVSLSSKGPAHDGRIKPEIIAFGDAGSSEAAAVVSGTALLIQDAYKQKFGVLPSASLVKAVLINSARDVGRPQVDFETGFGNVDALNAIRTIEAENFFLDEVTDGASKFFSIAVAAQAEQLKVTLVWNDLPADPFSEKALVNDLDITIRNVLTNETWDPWVLNNAPTVSALQSLAQRGKDRLNNVEQITLAFPAEGEYEIEISGYEVQDTQPLSIAYEINSGFEWRYPFATNPLQTDAVNLIRWRWYGTAETGLLQYRSVNEVTWQTIGEVDLTDHVFEWTTPSVTGLFQLRMVIGADHFDSEIFSISRPDRLSVGFNCDEQVMFTWNGEDAADAYRLYRVGEKYLEPILTTTDTFAIFQKSELETVYFTGVPVFGGVEGSRELTIDYDTQGTGCYFRSFVALNYVVNEQAEFDVTLGTTYNLQTVVLERLNGSMFEPVQTLATPVANNFLMTDDSPRAGINIYRARLITVAQENILSEEEEILFVSPADLYVFPNPVSRQEVLSVISNDQGTVMAELIDPLGKVVLSQQISGDVKVLDISETHPIQTGVYILKIKSGSGSFLTSRVMITE